MKFSEAMCRYEDGYKVRCKRWHDSCYIQSGNWRANDLCESDVNGFWELQEEPQRSLVPVSDACPSCLDRMIVTLGEEKRVIKRIKNRVWVQFKCPECSFNWACMFSEEKK